MIMKTVQKGSDKIDHVEYGDNVIYFYSSRNRQGRTETEMIPRRIIGRIMKDCTDEEYSILLDTVRKSAGDASEIKPSAVKRRPCRTCKNNGTCKGRNSCLDQEAV